ncbi:hypothetical protein CSHISOI_08966, partial [Colletotrichum shisoi]
CPSPLHSKVSPLPGRLETGFLSNLPCSLVVRRSVMVPIDRDMGPSLPAQAVNSVASSATSIWVLAIRVAPLVSCLLDSRAARPSLAGCTVRPFVSLRCLAHHGHQQTISSKLSMG